MARCHRRTATALAGCASARTSVLRRSASACRRAVRWSAAAPGLQGARCRCTRLPLYRRTAPSAPGPRPSWLRSPGCGPPQSGCAAPATPRAHALGRASWRRWCPAWPGPGCWGAAGQSLHTHRWGGGSAVPCGPGHCSQGAAGNLPSVCMQCLHQAASLQTGDDVAGCGHLLHLWHLLP